MDEEPDELETLRMQRESILQAGSGVSRSVTDDIRKSPVKRDAPEADDQPESTPFSKDGDDLFSWVRGMRREWDTDSGPDAEIEKIMFSNETSETPLVANQMEKYPDSVDLGPVITKVFRLEDPDQAHERDVILSGFMTKEAPIIRVIKDEIVYDEKKSEWKALLMYQKFLFKKPE